MISCLRVSPRATDRLHRASRRGRHSRDLKVVDRQGRVTTVSAGYRRSRPGWSRTGVRSTSARAGREGASADQPREPRGRERVAVELAVAASARRVPNGDMLSPDDTVDGGPRRGKECGGGGAARRQPVLPLRPVRRRRACSRHRIGEASGPNYALYVQGTDGSACLAREGDGQALSPTGSRLASSETARPAARGRAHGRRRDARASTGPVTDTKGRVDSRGAGRVSGPSARRGAPLRQAGRGPPRAASPAASDC